MKVLGDYVKQGAWLAGLPTLVRRQRRLEKQLAPLEQLQRREKDTRDQIDALLQRAGVQKGEAVLCNGYEVAHNERAGRTSINADTLRGAGVPELDIRLATETGKPSQFATVKPAKGATVRAA